MSGYLVHTGESAFTVVATESTDVSQHSVPEKGTGGVAARHQKMRRFACTRGGEVLVQALDGLANGRLEE